jgi:hypothetical protein
MAVQFDIGDRIRFKPKDDFETLSLEISKQGDSTYSAKLIVDGVEAIESEASISSAPERLQHMMQWIMTHDDFLAAHHCRVDRAFLHLVRKRARLRLVKARPRSRKSNRDKS